MRESEYARLKEILGCDRVTAPAKTYDMISACLEHEIEDRAQVSPLKSEILARTILLQKQTEANMAEAPRPGIKTSVPKPKGQGSLAYYQRLIKAIPKIHKQHILNYANMMGHHKKLATICARELRRGLSKTSKTNPNLKNKRINKELQRLVSRIEREEKDRMRRADEEKEIQKKNEEALREELRQKRKFNYLMSQTEAFASFFLNRQADREGGEEGLLAAQSHLAHVREFDAPEKRRDRGVGSEPAAAAGASDAAEPAYVHQEVAQPRILRTTLKQYQLKGLNWLVNLYNQGINGILADDMGLGKTVQMISLLGYLAETEGVWGPFLIVTPASTLHNWENELARFIPDFSVVVYYGNMQERSDLKKRFKDSNVVVTSYQVAVSDESILRRIRWQYMILDEAQAIKSISSQRWKILLGFKARNRCLLTGTPIQNNMQELWSLLHFIMPTLFDSLSEFSEWFLTDNGVDETQVDKLHTILRPFMLRRHKDDIKDEIGTKEMINIYCTLSSRQRVLYDEVVNPHYSRDLFAKCSSGTSPKSEYENTIMYLKKICNHPDLFEKPEPSSAFCLTVQGEAPLVEHRAYLRPYISAATVFREKPYWENALLGACAGLERYYLNKRRIVGERSPPEETIAAELGRQREAIARKLGRFSLLNEAVNRRVATSNLSLETPRTGLRRAARQQAHSLRYFDRMTYVPPITAFIADSGKLVELDILLRRLKTEGHRPLIYFQMTRMMDLFEEYLVKMEYSYLRLDGSCKVSARKELVREWQTKDIFVFILSTRAGGVGINLTAADTVIFYDSDWNPTVDQQAMDRVHRLGQTKKVSVYRLITRDSIEEKIMERAGKKDEMQKIVIRGNVFEGE